MCPWPTIEAMQDSASWRSTSWRSTPAAVRTDPSTWLPGCSALLEPVGGGQQGRGNYRTSQAWFYRLHGRWAVTLMIRSSSDSAPEVPTFCVDTQPVTCSRLILPCSQSRRAAAGEAGLGHADEHLHSVPCCLRQRLCRETVGSQLALQAAAAYVACASSLTVTVS